MASEDVWFMLGKVKDEAHLQKLTEVAHELDQTKFSCTLSVRANVAGIDICPHAPKTIKNYADFTLYAAEMTILALSKALGDKDNA
jgi:hypothetical protein